MGRVPGSKNNAHKKKEYKKRHATWCRPRDIDQIQDDIKKEHETMKKTEFETDEDLPGLVRVCVCVYPICVYPYMYIYLYVYAL